MPSFPGPIFVVGMPRSGTKLLRGLLNSHSQIGIPLNETELLPSWIRKWAHFGNLHNRDTFEAFYQYNIETFYFQNRLREHGQQIASQKWFDLCDGDFSIANVFEQLIRHDADIHDGIWGDKSPSYLRHLPEIKAVFPQAKFIHIVRDVRDYVLSIEKAFGKNRFRAAQRWSDAILKAQKDGETFAEQYTFVHYELLVDNPEPLLRKLCDFIGVNFEEGMLDLSRPTENLGDTKGQATVVAGNYGKYKAQMSNQEIRELEELAGEALRSLNYECAFTGPSRRLEAIEEYRYHLQDIVALLRQEAQESGWRSSLRRRIGHFWKTQL